MSNSASSMLTQPVNVYKIKDGNMLFISRNVIDRVYTLALAWHITGNTNFAERAWAELGQVSSTNFSDWDPGHFLDTAEMTHACAIGYDWLYDFLSASRRETIRMAIINKGLIAYTNAISAKVSISWWATPEGNNWNFVCNGGMVLGALAIGSEDTSLSEFVLSNGIASVGPIMRHYTTDNGGWYEGPGY
jgi:hypothetical protein